MDLKERFEIWRNVYSLQIDFLRELGTYKLNAAKSDLVTAVASNQIAVARMKAHIAQELQGALRRLHQMEARTATKVKRLMAMARNAAYIQNGDDMTRSRMQLMWAAYKVFERMVPVQQLEPTMRMDLHPGARKGTQYVNKAEPTEHCQNIPEHVDNAHMLVGYIKRRHYLPIRGSLAHRHVLKVFEAIANVAASQLDKMQNAIEQMRSNTYKVWNPLIIAGLPDTMDVKKILYNGMKEL